MIKFKNKKANEKKNLKACIDSFADTIGVLDNFISENFVEHI